MNDAVIVDLDCCDASGLLCEKWSLDNLTVTEFNQAMTEFAAERNPSGGYAKLRGTLLFTDATGEERSIEFRIDVDYRMSEGHTLSERFAKAARYWTTDKGREFAIASNDDATELHALYAAASEATRN